MTIEQELYASANAMRDLLMRAADEISQLREDLDKTRRGQLSTAIASTNGKQEPVRIA